MPITSLDDYGTVEGFQAWTLSDEISQLEEPDLLKRLVRARRILEVYGGFDSSKPNFQILMTELVYSLAENLHFWFGRTRTVSSGLKSERIGSYSYTRDTSSAAVTSLIEGDDTLNSLLVYLKDRTGRMVVTTRVFDQQSLPDVNGVRYYLDSFDNRLAHYLRRNNVTPEEYRYLVYGC